MKGGKSKADSRKVDRRVGVRKQTKKGKKVAKDSNKPKRALSAYFVFLKDFRKEYTNKYPNNKASVVGKAAGIEWNSLSDEEKAPYVKKAAKRKEAYDRQMEAYNKKLASGDGDGESDKSKSDEERSEEEEEDDD